jgi:hypothetical protein
MMTGGSSIRHHAIDDGFRGRFSVNSIAIDGGGRSDVIIRDGRFIGKMGG